MDDETIATPWRRVVRYYPQRVQVLAMAALNLLLVTLAETGIDVSVVLVSSLNSFVLAGLVFVYGEKATHSKAAIEDWLEASEVQQ